MPATSLGRFRALAALIIGSALLASIVLAIPRGYARAEDGFDFSDPELAAEAEQAVGGMVISTSCADPSGNKPGEPCLSEESTVFHPLGSGSVQSIIGNVIKYVIGLVGILALVMFIYGGLTWMLAAGSPDKITKAKNTIIWAILGLVMVFASYAVVSFVMQAVGV